MVLLSSERSKAVKLEISQGEAVVTSNNPDLGDARDELDIDYAGENLSIGFNAKYVLEALGSLHAKEIRLGLQGDLSPATLVPTNDEEALAVVKEEPPGVVLLDEDFGFDPATSEMRKVGTDATKEMRAVLDEREGTRSVGHRRMLIVGCTGRVRERGAPEGRTRRGAGPRDREALPGGRDQDRQTCGNARRRICIFGNAQRRCSEKPRWDHYQTRYTYTSPKPAIWST